MPNGAEAYDEAYDDAYDEAYDGEAMDEAARRFRPRPVATARPRPLPPRPADRPVTQAQLQIAVNKLDGDIRRNSTAIQKVNTNLTALGRDVRRQTNNSRKTQKDISALRDAIVILPLLAGGNSTLGPILPLLLLSGVGDSASGSSGGLLGGGDSSSLLLLLAVSGGLGGRKP
jgi:hypothetical protein